MRDTFQRHAYLALLLVIIIRPLNIGRFNDIEHLTWLAVWFTVHMGLWMMQMYINNYICYSLDQHLFYKRNKTKQKAVWVNLIFFNLDPCARKYKYNLFNKLKKNVQSQQNYFVASTRALTYQCSHGKL